LVPGAAVTPALARQLGPPRLGQWFVDDTSAVISTSVAPSWRRARIIGRAITLDERQLHHAASCRQRFSFLAAARGTRGDTEVWIPLDPSRSTRGRGGQLRVRPR
jgi:hypothetical protein